MTRQKVRKLSPIRNFRTLYMLLVIFAFMGTLILLLIFKINNRTVSNLNQGKFSNSLPINSDTSGSVGIAPNQPNQNTVTVSNNAVFPKSYKIGATIAPSDIDINELYNSTNQKRSLAGAAGLNLNRKLTLAAQDKCKDMVDKNYWSHYSPDGTAPWTFDINQGYSYQKLGENLAVGFFDAQSTVDGWLASPEHRQNLLNPAFSDVGFAVCKSNSFAGTHNQQALIIVQHLGAPR